MRDEEQAKLTNTQRLPKEDFAGPKPIDDLPFENNEPWARIADRTERGFSLVERWRGWARWH
jgi:hypothetical protein